MRRSVAVVVGIVLGAALGALGAYVFGISLRVILDSGAFTDDDSVDTAFRSVGYLVAGGLVGPVVGAVVGWARGWRWWQRCLLGAVLGAALTAVGTWLYVGHVLVLATGALALTGALLGLVQSAMTAIVERIAPVRG